MAAPRRLRPATPPLPAHSLSSHACLAACPCSKTLELAALPDVPPEERRRMLAFVVVGGGPTG